MPEPNLPLLHVGFSSMSHGTVNADEIKKKIPPLPEEKRVNLQNKYALTREQSILLVVSKKKKRFIFYHRKG